MRTALRIVNVLVWLAVWISVAISYGAVGDWPRMTGEAVIPALLCFVIDRGISRRHAAKPDGIR